MRRPLPCLSPATCPPYSSRYGQRPDRRRSYHPGRVATHPGTILLSPRLCSPRGSSLIRLSLWRNSKSAVRCAAGTRPTSPSGARAPTFSNASVPDVAWVEAWASSGPTSSSPTRTPSTSAPPSSALSHSSTRQSPRPACRPPRSSSRRRPRRSRPSPRRRQVVPRAVAPASGGHRRAAGSARGAGRAGGHGP